MRILIAALSLFLLAPSAPGQASGNPSRAHETKEELRKLFSELNEAIIKHDRAALERIYADEFQFIHSTGSVIDKASQISGILANSPALSSSPVPVPSFDQLRVYGDVAVLKGSSRGVVGTDIYVKRGGRWQIVQVQGTRLPPERKPIQLDPNVLDSFIGKYEFAPGAFATVTKGRGRSGMEARRQAESNAGAPI
jgi:hypothetical protein